MALQGVRSRSALQQLAGAIAGIYGRSSGSLVQQCNGFSSGSAAIIKQLRERSGAPIADVKAMLVANDWDMDKAYEALRKKGLAAAAKKASRHAAEGLVGASFAAAGAAAASSSGGCGSVVLVELNSETDFVARNDLFQGVLREVMAAAHGLGRAAAVGPDHALDVEQLLSARTPSGTTVSEAVTGLAAQVRENVRLRRAFRVDSGDGLVYSYVHQAAAPSLPPYGLVYSYVHQAAAPSLPPYGLVYSYVHQAAAPGLGKLASVVVLGPDGGQPLEPLAATPSLASAGEGLAMHVAGLRPAFLTRGSVPPEVLAHERAVLTEQLANDASCKGKPPQVVAKIIEGRLSKALAEQCLAEQRYVLDDSVTVDGLVARLRKELGRPLGVSGFLRVQCGEGLGPKAGGGFAAEVAKIVSET
ncbi:hypothetical protein HYH03_001107 [Edaphochlamys debaryana]|uniref:Elongation factor Ts, mitochondrial n=1 Tax=Edaphochlamys debaryana TaxID=47281 RepID=A0A836C723_9CHLO|nr:hypothetical protein HYH03_001107 [Edaphochlamys debaryana]|eukprot:KAG2501312.1 hypothetical protein HYH03_001107 [Edaphochlamys debaryana]